MISFKDSTPNINMAPKREIIYPHILECCQHCPDIFWENVFEDLAYGRPPYGTYISNDFLSCNYKKKDFSYKIEENKNALILYQEIYDLLKNRLGLLSRQDKAKNKLEFENTEETLKKSRKTWTDIKKKNIKELLIEQYVVKMKNLHKLGIKQARFLNSIISIAMVFKVITSSDIDYRDGIIHNIDGIDFAKRKVILQRDLYSTNVPFTPEIVMDQKLMSEHWDKFLKDLRKMVDATS